MKETLLKTSFGPLFCGHFLQKRSTIFLLKIISCWVLIKRSWTGKLALCSQILNWIYLSQEKGQKPLKFGVFSKWSNLGDCLPFSGNRDIQFKI